MAPIIRVKSKAGSKRQQLSEVVLNDDHGWILQPEMETLPWDSEYELQFPVQIPSSYRALIQPSFQNQVRPHKKMKLDCSPVKSLSLTNEDLSNNQLLVENIPPEATMSDLQEHLSSLGQIHSLNVLRARNRNIRRQLNSVTATIFIEKHSNLSQLGSFYFEELGNDVSAYLIRRPSLALSWLRLCHLPHRAKAKTLKKVLASHITISEVVKHSQVGRSAILTFKEYGAVQSILEAQHRMNKLLGNRLIFTANHDYVKMISVRPVRALSLKLPLNYPLPSWPSDTKIFHHDMTTNAHNKTHTDDTKSIENGLQLHACQGDPEHIEAMEWEHGEDLPPNTICLVPVPANTKRKRLRKLVAECGAVVEVVRHLDRCPAHAYVTFQAKEGVDRALQDQCQLDDSGSMLIHVAASKTLSSAYLTELLFQAGCMNGEHSLLCEASVFEHYARHSSENDDGTPTILNGAPTILNGAPMILNGAPMMQNGAPTILNGAPTILNGAPMMQNGAPTILNGAPTLQNGAPTMQNDEPTMQSDAPHGRHTKSSNPFALPPNTVLVVGGLGDAKKEWVKKAFTHCGRVLWVELLQEMWPVHAYVSYIDPRHAAEAVEAQPQITEHRMTLTVAAERKFTQSQIVELGKKHPKLLLDGTAQTTPLFYRQEMKAPAWASYCGR